MHLFNLNLYYFIMLFLALTILTISSGLILVAGLAWLADKFNWLD